MKEEYIACLERLISHLEIHGPDGTSDFSYVNLIDGFDYQPLQGIRKILQTLPQTPELS